VQQAPEAAGPLAKMYAAFARQFNLGKSAEDALDQFTQLAERAASQPRGNPEAEAAQAELQIKAKELEIKMQEMALRTQESQQGQQTDSQIKAAELQLKGQESQTRAQIDAAKLQLDAEKLQLEREKLDIERGRLGVEARKADHEVNVKMAEVSARHAEVNTKDMGMAQDRFNEAMQGVVTPIIEEIRSGNAELAKGFQAQMQALADAISQGNRQMIGAMTAPREIERDPKTGRPTGRARILWEPEAVN